MVTKGKRRTLRHKRSKSRSKSRRVHRAHKTHKAHTRKRLRGGNYETDATTRTTEGTPTKPLNKFVVTVPGRGVMSGTAYKQLMEDLDRNGNREYF